jgi:hypothetical protein
VIDVLILGLLVYLPLAFGGVMPSNLTRPDGRPGLDVGPRT